MSRIKCKHKTDETSLPQIRYSRHLTLSKWIMKSPEEKSKEHFIQVLELMTCQSALVIMYASIS